MRYGPSISLLAAVFAIVALGVAPDAALAQDETIDACVHHGSGVVYLPGDRGSAGETCANKDEELSWDAGGGSAFTTTIVTSATVATTVLGGTRSSLLATARCPAGAKVLGGGGTIEGGGIRPGPALVDSSPVSNPEGWAVVYRLDHTDGAFQRRVTANAYAVCAELSS